MQVHIQYRYSVTPIAVDGALGSPADIVLHTFGDSVGPPLNNGNYASIIKTVPGFYSGINYRKIIRRGKLFLDDNIADSHVILSGAPFH